MSKHLGNYAEDYADLNTKFTTVSTSGAPTTLSGTPIVSCYKSNGTTESTAGITLTADFDAVTGLNNVKVDLSADAFYATGNDYQLVITQGTIGGTSAIGYVIAEFSIENRFMRGTDSGALASVCTEARLAELDAGNMPTDLTNIEADTQDIQTQVGTAGAGLTDLGGMSTGMKAEVNTEVVDTLNVDTYAEPAQGTPAATASLVTKISYIYKAWRNKKTQTATTFSLFNDDTTTVDHKSTVSDDGTTATITEMTTGP